MGAQVGPTAAVGPAALPRSPTPEPSAASDPQSGAQRAFLAGYLAAGGDAALAAHVLRVIACESGWRDDRSGGYESVAQFTPDSWARAGGGDPADMGTTGGNVARWIALIGVQNAGTTSGFPMCWWR